MYVQIERATLEDLTEILQLQKLAYQQEAERYGDCHIAPLTQTLAELRAEYPTTLFLKLVQDNKIVGSVKGRKAKETCHLGRLMVHPQYQRQGFGTALIKKLEEEFAKDSEITRIELFTGARSFNNIRLYEAQGYAIFKTEAFDKNNPCSEKVVFMEKAIRGSC